MKRLIFTDPHLDEASLSEISSIFLEIMKYEADELIMVGDYFNKANPSSLEILVGTELACRLLGKYKKVIFVEGNHDKTRGISAVRYLGFLGIQIVEDYVDEDNNYYGHFMTNKSQMEYGTAKCSMTDLKKYNYVFLGHQHSFQELGVKRFHISSIRYVNFNEAEDENKYIALLEDDKVEFIPLKSTIPMQDVTSIQELSDIDPETKVRIIIASFDQFKKEINEINQYRKKFEEFKIKMDFKPEPVKANIKPVEKKNLQSTVAEWLTKVTDKDVSDLLTKEFKAGGLI